MKLTLIYRWGDTAKNEMKLTLDEVVSYSEVQSLDDRLVREKR